VRCIDAKMCHFEECHLIVNSWCIQYIISCWCTLDSIIVWCSTMSVPWALLYKKWVKCTVDTTVSFGVPNGVLWTPLILWYPKRLVPRFYFKGFLHCLKEGPKISAEKNCSPLPLLANYIEIFVHPSQVLL